MKQSWNDMSFQKKWLFFGIYENKNTIITCVGLQPAFKNTILMIVHHIKMSFKGRLDPVRNIQAWTTSKKDMIQNVWCSIFPNEAYIQTGAQGGTPWGGVQPVSILKKWFYNVDI